MIVYFKVRSNVHSCDLCSKEYTQRASLRNHKRKYHKVEPKVQTRDEEVASFDVEPSSEERI